jgi:hypothetical protein
MSLVTVVNNKPITTASPFVADVAAIISRLIAIDADKDGQISLSEGLVVGQDIIVKVMRHYSTASEAIEELKDANSAERKELIAVFGQGFDLSNKEAEGLIEDTLAFVEGAVTEAINIGQRWADLLKK